MSQSEFSTTITATVMLAAIVRANNLTPRQTMLLKRRVGASVRQAMEEAGYAVLEAEAQEKLPEIINQI